MTTLRISANSVGHYNVCRRFYWIYKVLNRRRVRSSVGRVAGKGIHAGIEGMNRGRSVAEQDSAIDAVLAAEPMPVEDYRQAAYLRDALAAFRAEYMPRLAHWVIEEVEAHSEIELGLVTHEGQGRGDMHQVRVVYEFRRDLVAVSPEGVRSVWDFKTASRNEQAEVEASRVSSAYKGYCWTYRKQTGKPCNWVQQRRIIMRKPSKSGVAFEFPEDGAIYFSDEVLDEWHRQTLRTAVEILERNPQDPDSWPLSGTTLGACRMQFGVCDFCSVCELPPDQRMLKLSTDEFEDARHHNHENNTTD